jgi:predicted oxidoreductase
MTDKPDNVGHPNRMPSIQTQNSPVRDPDLPIGLPLTTELAYGCWRIAGTQVPVDVSPDQRTVGKQAVWSALDSGYTVFDLADVYCDGLCEEIFGEALRERCTDRDTVQVIGKVGIRCPGDPVPDAPYRYDFSAAYLETAVEASLRRMKLEHLDGLLLHRPDYLMDPCEVASVWDRLQRAGKVRWFGISNFKPTQVQALQAAWQQPLVAHQVEIHLLHLDPFDDGTLDQCLTTGMRPMAWSPLAGGRLGLPNSPKASASASGQTQNSHQDMVQTSVAVEIHRIASELNVDVATIALAWLREHPARILPVIGSIRPERIRELASHSKLRLGRERWYRLFELARGTRLP